MLYRFCSKFRALSSSAKKFENRLRFDKVTESLNVGAFLRHSVEFDRTRRGAVHGGSVRLFGDLCGHN